MSGRGVFLALVAAGLIAGCGGAGPATEDGASLRSEAAQVPTQAALPPAIPAGNGPGTTVGEPIREEGAAVLPMEPQGRHVEPLVAYGDKILVKSIDGNAAPGSAPFEYFTWDPATGRADPAWTGEPGGQDFVSGAEGPWVATVRTGMELPFPDWKLILRNLETGEVREIAESVEGLGEEDALEPLLPTGFAPYPAISGGRVAWIEGSRNAAGQTVRRVQVYSIETNESRTLAETVAGEGDSWGVALGGSVAAWAFRDDKGGKSGIRVMHLGSGEARDVVESDAVFSLALSGDGTHLAWDEGMTAKFALDLATGERVQYAGAIGWGATASGDYVSWIPATGRGGRAGFYSFSTGEVRFREDIPGAMMNLAQVMGPWFVWQERPLDPALAGRYYFMRLAGS